MNDCLHAAEQRVRTVYYLMCGACKKVLVVTYCNYPVECHPKCALAAVCVQPARERHHAQVPLEVSAELQEALRPTIEAR